MIVAIVGALLLGVVVIRNALVSQYAETNPGRASAVWSGHPTSELWAGLTQIGVTAREKKPVPASTLAVIRDAARKSPLAPEPFVVRGVEAQESGNRRLAIAAFKAAALRDGRSIPARYFLAEQYLRSGDANDGLKEIAMLARMVPKGVDNLGPYIAVYARDPRTRPQIVALFRDNPGIELAALTSLAADPSNADVVLQLATPSSRPPQWAARLLESLINAGEFEKARATWAKLSHISPPPSDLIFDATFQRPDVPAPFNWALTSSSVGLAERQAGGRLHVLFYGQDDGVLAKQLLVLPPGRYRLAMHVGGDLAHARALSWGVTCVGAEKALVAVPLASAAPNATFVVPAGCAAQSLGLMASAPDIPQQSDVTISGLSLSRDGGDG